MDHFIDMIGWAIKREFAPHYVLVDSRFIMDGANKPIFSIQTIITAPILVLMLMKAIARWYIKERTMI